jgi:LysM repeat protein
MKGILRFPAPLVSISLALLCLLFFSCSSVPSVVPTTSGLTLGAEKELASDYAGAMQEYKEHLYSLPKEADHVEAYLRIARCAMKLRDYRQAREYFKLADSGTDSTEVRFEAAKGVGDSYYYESSFVLAASYLHDAERLQRNPVILDEIYYKLAVCNQRLQNETAAQDYYAKVSRYAPRAGEPSFEPWHDAPVSPEEVPTTGGPRVIDRASWHARPMKRNYDPMGQIFRLTVHHSAIVDTDRDFDSSARAIKDIQASHMGSKNGWADIGYHYLIDRAGRIWEGRPIYIQGAHAGNPEANRGNIGICLLGDYGEQEPAGEQKAALRDLIIHLILAYQISTDQLYTHREVRKLYHLSATECPGARLQSYFDSLRAELRHGFSPGQHLARSAEAYHLVHRGETLFQISRQYGVTVTDLKSANMLAGDGDIEVGQKLRIPR